MFTKFWRPAAALVLAVAAVYIAGPMPLHYDPQVDPESVAWAQAIGRLLALTLAVGCLWWLKVDEEIA